MCIELLVDLTIWAFPKPNRQPILNQNFYNIFISYNCLVQSKYWTNPLFDIYISELKYTCDVNLLFKLSIIFSGMECYFLLSVFIHPDVLQFGHFHGHFLQQCLPKGIQGRNAILNEDDILLIDMFNISRYRKIV